MPPPDKPWRPFVVLTAATPRVAGRALRSVLEESGYAVLDAESGHQALELARLERPDAVLVDMSVADLPALEICRRLSGDPAFNPSTPIILLTAHGSARTERLEAYASGAWDLCSHPIDGPALLLKLQTYMRARHAAERLLQGSLLDEETGLYNERGARRRAGELAADARRRREPLACMALLPVVAGASGDLDLRTLQIIATTITRHVRSSDIVSRIGANEFGVLAPATDAGGAARLIERLRAAFGAPPPDDVGARPLITLRASYRVSSDFESMEPVDMLLQALAELAGPTLTLEPGGLARFIPPSHPDRR
jgi:PleD family two-component response regulator